MTFDRWEYVRGRGWIAIMHSESPQSEIPTIEVGGRHAIDGHEYLVTGVEYSIGIDYGKMFGLVIRGEPA